MDTKILSAMLFATTLLATSCSDDESSLLTPHSSLNREITLRATALTVEKDPMTRASLADEGQADLWVFDDETLLTHQTSTDADFGQPTLTLSYGTHNLRVISTRMAHAAISPDGILTGDSPKSTFANTLSLTVTPETAAEQTITLGRQTYMLTVLADDAWPASYGKMEVSIAPDYTALNTRTFAGVAPSGTYLRTITLPATLANLTGCSVSLTGFTPSAEEYMTTVTIKLYKADNQTILQQHTVSDVPLQRNYKTTLHGNLFAKEPKLSVSVDAEYGGEKEVTL